MLLCFPTPCHGACCQLSTLRADAHNIQQEGLSQPLQVLQQSACAAVTHIGLITFQSSSSKGSLINSQAVNCQACRGAVLSSGICVEGETKGRKKHGTITCVLRHKVRRYRSSSSLLNVAWQMMHLGGRGASLRHYQLIQVRPINFPLSSQANSDAYVTTAFVASYAILLCHLQWECDSVRAVRRSASNGWSSALSPEPGTNNILLSPVT